MINEKKKITDTEWSLISWTFRYKAYQRFSIEFVNERSQVTEMCFY